VALGTLTASLATPQRYGGDAFLRGFWYAVLQCQSSGETEPTKAIALAGFKHLCLNALADFKLFPDEPSIHTEAFQAINDNEEARESDGFTGLRMVLLVDYGFKQFRTKSFKKQSDKYIAVAAWLCEHLRFPDEKKANGRDRSPPGNGGQTPLA